MHDPHRGKGGLCILPPSPAVTSIPCPSVYRGGVGYSCVDSTMLTAVVLGLARLTMMARGPTPSDKHTPPYTSAPAPPAGGGTQGCTPTPEPKTDLICASVRVSPPRSPRHRVHYVRDHRGGQWFPTLVSRMLRSAAGHSLGSAWDGLVAHPRSPWLVASPMQQQPMHASRIELSKLVST